MKTLPAVELIDLTKCYGGVEVVARLSLTLAAGTIFGFLGPNGAGKSTTIKMMTGLEKPDAGECRLLGVPLRGEALAIKRQLGVMPDGLALFEELSVWEHLDLIRAAFNLPMNDFERRSAQLLRLLELTSQARQLARRCSYGTRKKIALAMALLPNPKLLNWLTL